jgi:hypothetical protein
VMVAEPEAIADTLPDVEPTVATDGALELHVPPVVVFESVAVVPSHRPVAPVIVAGSG